MLTAGRESREITDIPQFDQKWWKKHKGLLVPETGFGKLLGAFEVAQDHRQ
jgi:hypothetical protein